MKEEIRKIVASIFNVAGGGPLSKREFVNMLAHNLRWFDPETSKKLLNAAVRSAQIRVTPDGMLERGFDPEGVTLEADYTPDPDLDLDEMSKPLLERLIEAVCDQGLSKKDAVKMINHVGEERNLLFPAAAIHVGISRGRDMSEFYNEVNTFITNGEM